MRIGLTSGDPNGIGIETILQVFADERMLKGLTPVLYASPDLVSNNLDAIGLKDLNWGEVDSAENAIQGQLNILNISVDSFNHLPGELTSEAGGYSYKSLEKAVDDLASSKVDILVTAPINKEAITQSGFKFPGHTEYLAHMANAEDVLMFLVAENLRIGIVTGHIALKDVAKSLSAKSIKSKLDIMHESLARDFGCPTPRIAILGLNPHAGDNGLMGDEERNIIAPVVKEANAAGMKVFGPYAADGFFGSGAYKNFDGVLAMYHDQGLAPFKAMSFGRGVNFTAGLPIVRTSPDHGTGFDIAGQGKASPDSMRSAIFLAQDILRNRLEHRELTANPLKLAPPKRDYRDSRR
jgi:4-hydroxythreonine-4-phosphate dehydrogenase